MIPTNDEYLLPVSDLKPKCLRIGVTVLFCAGNYTLPKCVVMNNTGEEDQKE